jgi:radial spoke head protein 9
MFPCAQIEIKEEARLAAVVSTIDEEVAVVPRGAYVKGPLGDVTTNKSFRGTCTLP